MTLTLFHSPISTCSQKVRLALAEKGLEFESRVLDMAGQEHLSSWYLGLNPNGVVPTLVHDGHPVVDSSVICEYLDDVFPEPALSPNGPAGRADMRSWMRYFEEVPTAAIRVPSFNALFARPLKQLSAADFAALTSRQPLRKHFYRDMGPDGFDAQTTARSLERLGACLDRVEISLRKQGPFLLGEMVTIADLVLVPIVVRMLDLGLGDLIEQCSRVKGWIAAIMARPSFAAAYYPGTRVNPTAWTVRYPTEIELQLRKEASP